MNDNLTIKHQGITFLLSVEPIRKVLPHEEVMPGGLSSIIASLVGSGAQLDPVIVDVTTGVALDGMHRVAALEKMGASKILTCKVDYSADSIGVGRWLRAYEGVSGPLLEDLKVRLNLTRVSRAEALSEVEGHRTPAAMFSGGMAFKSLIPFVSVRGGIGLVRIFDETAARSEVKPLIVSEVEARRLMDAGAFVFVPPSPSKADVLQCGLTGNLFPPKSTRHMLPARPVGVSYPLRWLVDARVSIEEANRRLADLLARSNMEVLPPGSEYKGRIYEEHLYRYERGGP